ncbi:MAG TPA: response regulator transcription factor [Novosphingobium sp.]|nr:response regulator transcription factor [Novosphingobium sp.]
MSETVLIADDHPLFRQALILAVGRVRPAARIIEAGTLAAAARLAAETADLVLVMLDLKMPGAVGYSGIALLHAERPQVPILVVSSAEGTTARQEARAFGAIGFVGKDSDLSAIEAAIAKVLGTRPPEAPAASEAPPPLAAAAPECAAELDTIRRQVADLTPTQLKVLLAVLDGQLNKQIAHGLGITEATVKAHMTAIMRKLDVRNRTQAALVARSLGLDIAH